MFCGKRTLQLKTEPSSLNMETWKGEKGRKESQRPVDLVKRSQRGRWEGETEANEKSWLRISHNWQQMSSHRFRECCKAQERISWISWVSCWKSKTTWAISEAARGSYPEGQCKTYSWLHNRHSGIQEDSGTISSELIKENIFSTQKFYIQWKYLSKMKA